MRAIFCTQSLSSMPSCLEKKRPYHRRPNPRHRGGPTCSRRFASPSGAPRHRGFHHRPSLTASFRTSNLVWLHLQLVFSRRPQCGVSHLIADEDHQRHMCSKLEELTVRVKQFVGSKLLLRKRALWPSPGRGSYGGIHFEREHGFVSTRASDDPRHLPTPPRHRG